MPKVLAAQTNFSVGELSPLLVSRVGLEQYQNACSTLVNFIVQRYGGIRKRGGFEYVASVKDHDAGVRLASFVYSTAQAYVLEFGDNYVRFYINGGQLESSGSPVEVATPWGTDDIWDLQFAQSADVLYIVHPNYAPRTLSRTSATTFSLDTIDFVDGPYLDLNTTQVTLTPSATGHATPLMTANNTPSGVASSGNSSATAYYAFDRDKQNDVSVATGPTGYLQYDFGSGNAVVVDNYWLVAPSYQAEDQDMFTQWAVQGSNDGSNWVTIDTRDGETGWSGSETRFYETSNKSSFRYYKIVFSGGGGDDAAVTALSEWAMHLAPQSQTAFNLTALATTGINGDQGFVASDVGRSIRLFGSDGVWRWARIQAYTSSTVVTIKLYGHALPDLSPIVNWQLGAWCDETGWPSAISFYSGRLCFANTATQPQTIWMSKVDNFTDFGVSSPLVDDDAINITIASESINEIRWITEGTNLFVGTSASIRTVGPSQATSAISPTNIKQRRETNYAASAILPIRFGNTAIYTGYYRRDIRELTYSFDVDGFVSQDLSILCNHICSPGIKQMGLSQNPDGIVWAVLDDGTFAGVTYERDQQVVAFHRHTIGGSFGSGNAVVESVATIPSTTSDETWVVVKRTIDGETKRYVERLSVGLSDTGSKEDAEYLDSFLTYSGSPASTISGLDHLEGETVKVWGDGAYLGEYEVASGEIDLGEYSVEKACIGLSYTSVMETLSPEMGSSGGSAQTAYGTVSEITLRLYRSLGGRVGGRDAVNMETIYYRTPSGAMDAAPDLKTDDYTTPIEMKWERGKRLRVDHSDPCPFNLLGMFYDLRVHG